MPQWLVVWLPVIAVFASAIITAVLTYYVVIPRQYQRAKAELAYNEYIKNKNHLYQKICKSIGSMNWHIEPIKSGNPPQITIALDRYNNVDDYEALFNSFNVSKRSQGRIKDHIENGEIKKARKIFQDDAIINHLYQTRNSVNELENLAGEAYIYTSENMYRLLENIISEARVIFKETIHNGENVGIIDYFTDIDENKYNKFKEVPYDKFVEHTEVVVKAIKEDIFPEFDRRK